MNTAKLLRASTKNFPFCFNPYQISEGQVLCPICVNGGRDKEILCIVEKESDLNTIENTNRYKGLYFILGGTLSALKETDIKRIRIKELEERLKNPESFGINNLNLKEIIIATNPTPEGDATALYLKRNLESLLPPGIKTTRLGKGLPVGGELEYADEETLESAFDGRK